MTTVIVILLITATIAAVALIARKVLRQRHREDSDPQSTQGPRDSQT
ncbi:hypothetical protein [Pseudactinotalea sp. Z1748]